MDTVRRNAFLEEVIRPQWLAVSGLTAIAASQALLAAADPIILRYTLDNGLSQRHVGAVWVGVSAFVILVALKMIMEVIARVASSRFRLRLARGLRGGFLQAMLTGDLARLRGMETGDLTARLTEDAETVEQFAADTAPMAVLDVFTIIASGGVLMWLDWRLAAILLVLAPAQPVIFRLMSRRLGEAVQRQREKESDLYSVISQIIAGHVAIRTFVANSSFLHRFDDRLSELVRVTTQLEVLSMIGPGAGEVFVAFIQFGVIIGLGSMLAFSGEATIGTIMAFYMYSLRLVGPIIRISRHMSRFKVAKVCFERIQSFKEQISHGMTPVPAGSVVATEQARETAFSPLDPTREEIRLTGIGYTYPRAERPALSNVSFTITKGEKLAIAGPKGSGKTTLGLILAGLLLPSAGRLEMTRPFAIVYVGKEPFLFPGTVRENIQFGSSFADDDLRASLEIVGAGPLINGLPAGLDAQVAEGGGNFSAGQQQKLAVARALVRHPDFIILDEATESFDSPSQQSLYAWLRDFDGGAIVITHSIRPVLWVDRILVIQEGRVVEYGTPEQLTAQETSRLMDLLQPRQETGRA